MSTYPGDGGRDEPREETTQPLSGWQQPEPQRGWDAPSSSDRPSPHPSDASTPYGQQPPPTQGQPTQGQPYAAPYAPGGPPPGFPMSRPDHPQATLALVLGLVGLAGGLATCGLLFLVSPFAWVIGRRSTREIAASGGHYGGEGSARAGYVTGVIGTIFLVLAIVAVVIYILVVIAVIGSSGTTSDYGNV